MIITKYTKLTDLHNHNIISTRCYNSLYRADFTTIHDLTLKTEKEIMKTRNLGRKFFEQVKELLNSNNFYFKNQLKSENETLPLEKLPLETPIRDVLFFNICNSLSIAGIKTIYDITTKTEEFIRTLPDMYEKRFEEVERLLSDNGYYFKSELIEEDLSESQLEPKNTNLDLNNEVVNNNIDLRLPLDTPVYELELSNYTLDLLEIAGIETIYDLTLKTENEVMSICGIGKKCFEEVKIKLNSEGYYFKEQVIVSAEFTLVNQIINYLNNDTQSLIKRIKKNKVLLLQFENILTEQKSLLQDEETLDNRLAELLEQIVEILTKGNEQNGTRKRIRKSNRTT